MIGGVSYEAAQEVTLREWAFSSSRRRCPGIAEGRSCPLDCPQRPTVLLHGFPKSARLIVFTRQLTEIGAKAMNHFIAEYLDQGRVVTRSKYRRVAFSPCAAAAGFFRTRLRLRSELN
jgi:hypothetical protein